MFAYLFEALIDDIGLLYFGCDPFGIQHRFKWMYLIEFDCLHETKYLIGSSEATSCVN